MKKLLLITTILGSFSIFAQFQQQQDLRGQLESDSDQRTQLNSKNSTAPFDELAGLECRTDYIIHETSKWPRFNRVVLRQGIVLEVNILGFIPIKNNITNFGEVFSFNGIKKEIIYLIESDTDVTSISVKVRNGDKFFNLLDNYQFKTKKGFTETIHLTELMKIENQHVTNVILTCLPAYR